MSDLKPYTETVLVRMDWDFPALKVPNPARGGAGSQLPAEIGHLLLIALGFDLDGAVGQISRPTRDSRRHCRVLAEVTVTHSLDTAGCDNVKPDWSHRNAETPPPLIAREISFSISHRVTIVVSPGVS